LQKIGEMQKFLNRTIICNKNDQTKSLCKNRLVQYSARMNVGGITTLTAIKPLFLLLISINKYKYFSRLFFAAMARRVEEND
jgi:hypothetical protein